MLLLPKAVRIYLASEPVDMRNSIDGLLNIIRDRWRTDAYSGHLFVFVSRRGDRVKVLTWERGGFVLYYKRLERGRFRLPTIEDEAETVELDATQLAMLLDGFDYSGVRRSKAWLPSERSNIPVDAAAGI